VGSGTSVKASLENLVVRNSGSRSATSDYLHVSLRSRIGTAPEILDLRTRFGSPFKSVSLTISISFGMGNMTPAANDALMGVSIR